MEEPKEKHTRSRAAGKSLFDLYGISKFHQEVTLPIRQLHPQPLPNIGAQAPQPTQNKSLLRPSNLSFEIQLSAERMGLLTLDRPSEPENNGARCTILGRLLMDEKLLSDAEEEVGDQQYRERSVPWSKNFRALHSGGTLELLEVKEKFSGVPRQHGKTIGFVREKGNNKILMSSMSGWKMHDGSSPKMLDSQSWTVAVREFCHLVRHKLPRWWLDRETEGKYYSSHIEKRLVLWYVCHCISDEMTGFLDEDRLNDIRERSPPLELILTMDKEPCLDCKEFTNMISQLSGIRFHFEILPVVAQTTVVKVGNGRIKRRLCRGTSVFEAVKRGRPKKKKTERKIRKTNTRITNFVRQTPSNRATRRNGLLAPTGGSPFSFETLDRLDRRRFKKGKRGSQKNPFVLN